MADPCQSFLPLIEGIASVLGGAHSFACKAQRAPTFALGNLLRESSSLFFCSGIGRGDCQLAFAQQANNPRRLGGGEIDSAGGGRS